MYIHCSDSLSHSQPNHMRSYMNSLKSMLTMSFHVLHFPGYVSTGLIRMNGPIPAAMPRSVSVNRRPVPSPSNFIFISAFTHIAASECPNSKHYTPYEKIAPVYFNHACRLLSHTQHLCQGTSLPLHILYLNLPFQFHCQCGLHGPNGTYAPVSSRARRLWI